MRPATPSSVRHAERVPPTVVLARCRRPAGTVSARPTRIAAAVPAIATFALPRCARTIAATKRWANPARRARRIAASARTTRAAPRTGRPVAATMTSPPVCARSIHCAAAAPGTRHARETSISSAAAPAGRVGAATAPAVRQRPVQVARANAGPARSRFVATAPATWPRIVLPARSTVACASPTTAAGRAPRPGAPRPTSQRACAPRTLTAVRRLGTIYVRMRSRRSAAGPARCLTLAATGCARSNAGKGP